MRSRFVLPAFAIVMLATAIFLYFRSRSSSSRATANPLSPTRRGGFSETIFKFAPAPQDQGPAGRGWQEAKTTLTFADPEDKTRRAWTCNLVIGMPLRAEKWGDLTPEYAAYAAAATATDAASAVISKQPDWTAATFCAPWRDEMQRRLDGIEGLSAKVTGSE